MPLPFIEKVINSLNKEILERLELSKLIEHPGESGRAREQIITGYLEDILPKNIKIGTGFVIDAVGGVSKQIDVLVYRDDYHPLIKVGNVHYFMVESVIAIIEVKASISNVKTLNQALDNIKSVKSLDRTNNGFNKIISDGKRAVGYINKNKFEHQIFGAILTEKSLSIETLAQEFQIFYENNPLMNTWPNIYADVRGSSLRFITKEFTATAIPSDAFGFIISDPDAENYTPPLLEITFELLNFLRITPLIDYNPCDYFYGTVGESKIARQFPSYFIELKKLMI
nr:DUF6602 domain-containing protein [uncultured Moellerella sp.]